MEQYSHNQIAEMQETNWWYEGRRRVIADYLKKYYTSQELNRVLDVGCGVGANYKLLHQYSKEVAGIDIAQEALKYAQTQGYEPIVLGSVEDMPIPPKSIDLAICTDVLEHVDDKVAAAQLYSVLRGGGRVIITVPAFSSLWNENDDYSHHLRRYTKAQLHTVLIEAGFKIEYLRFWNHVMFFPVWIAARFYHKKPSGSQLHNNLTRIPTWMNVPLIFLLTFERILNRIVPVPFGVSLIAVAKKDL